MRVSLVTARGVVAGRWPRGARQAYDVNGAGLQRKIPPFRAVGPLGSTGTRTFDPVVEKTVEPVERVRLGTETVSGEETVSEEVREEHIEGDVQRR
jgi:hypothetical protein